MASVSISPLLLINIHRLLKLGANSDESEAVPDEIQERILTYLSDEHSSLASCALVSKRWRHFSRRIRFRDHPVVIVAWSHRINSLIETVTSEHCSLNSHISAATLRSFHPDRMIQGKMSLLERYLVDVIAQFKNLLKLTLDGILWDCFSPSAIEVILSFSNLTTLTLHNAEFSHPDQLLSALSHSQKTLRTLRIGAVKFRQPTSNGEITIDAMDFQYLKVEILVGLEFLSQIATLLNRKELKVHTFVCQGTNNYTSDSEAVIELKTLIRRFGASLATVRFPDGIGGVFALYLASDPSNPIALEKNPNLITMDVGKIPLEPGRLDGSVWLSGLLSTIQPGNRLQVIEISVVASLLCNDHDAISRYLWEPVEDVLAERDRFYTMPTVRIFAIGWGSRTHDVVRILGQCFPRVKREGKLEVVTSVTPLYEAVRGIL